MTHSLAAGALMQRVTLQSKSVTRDALGGEVVTWTTVASPASDGKWAADVQALSGRALIAAQQAQSEVVVRILIRHRTDIAADWRVVHGSEVYDIHAIIPDGDGVFLNLQCAKGLKNG